MKLITTKHCNKNSGLIAVSGIIDGPGGHALKAQFAPTEIYVYI